MLLSNFSYFYDVGKLATTYLSAPNVLATEVHTVNIRLIGSRMSTKTVQSIKGFIELGYAFTQMGYQTATDVFRYEPQGAGETYQETLGVCEDIYDIDINRNNANQTKRTLQLGNNYIRVHGVMSNRKKKTAKLGIARRGANKDIQIRVFEEATEFPDEKLISLCNQATGGAKFNINIFIANP